MGRSPRRLVFISRMADRPAGELAGGLLVLDCNLPIDENQFGSRRPLQRLLVGRRVAERRRIEGDYVSEVARLQMTTVVQAEHFGRQTGRAINRLGERNDFAFDRIAADLAWEGAKRSRMGLSQR